MYRPRRKRPPNAYRCSRGAQRISWVPPADQESERRVETTEFLKQTGLFSKCSDKELEGVVSTAKQRSFDEGATMVREGDPGARGFYLILSGRAEVRKAGQALTQMGPGDFFGEMALLLDDTPRTADVVAVEPTTTLVMTQWDFKALLKSHPEIASHIMLELAQRLSNTDQALSE